MIRMLQTMLNLIVSVILGGMEKFLRPTLIVSDEAETASTDGKIWVRLPKVFLGVSPEKDIRVFAGLLAHEVGHWLQPLDQIDSVEKATGINHDVVNILLDIQLEAFVAKVFPFLELPLIATRSVISGKMAGKYRKEFKEATSFVEAVFPTLLFGRFCVDQKESFGDIDRVKLFKKLNNSTLSGATRDRLFAIYERAGKFQKFSASQLPDKIKQLARDFPELCFQGTCLLLLGGQTSSGGDGLPILKKKAEEAEATIGDGTSPVLICQEEMYGTVQPSHAVAVLSAKLSVRWRSPNRSASLMGPGRFNRLSAVRNDPIPFSMPSPTRGYENNPQTKVFLGVDWSRSMDGGRWQAALEAAQAITLAIRASGGDVRVGLFAENLWHAEGYAADALFCLALGRLDLTRAKGKDTCFGWLRRVWTEFPTHRVVLLTDGDGHPPATVFPSEKKRTAAVLLQTTKGDAVKVVAENVVRVNRLEELASAWATLIPRVSM